MFVSWYHTAPPNSYLVITGARVEGVKIKKKGFVWPFQKVTKISVTPFHFNKDLMTMTSEKLQVCLPVNFTIGPQDNLDSLRKYAVLLTGDADGTIDSKKQTIPSGRDHIREIVQGIIEGETRSVVANLTMTELFEQRNLYKKKVVDHVQSELTQFGLCIYNASIKELRDMPGSQYLEFQSRKAHESALNQAKTDVAHARMLGEIGEANNVGKTKQEIAKINAQTALLETDRKIEKAQADSKFKSQEIDIERRLQIERIQADRAAELKDAELQKVVQESKALMELERQRAVTVTKAKVAKESAAQEADALLYKHRQDADARAYQAAKAADAELYGAQKQADGDFCRKERETEARILQETKSADAELYRKQQEAKGNFELKQKEAEALYVRHEREAAGIMQLAGAYEKLGQVLGGPAGVRDWMMISNGTPVALAKANAEAIRGLQPKISVWTQGGAQDGAAGSFAPIRDIMQSLPPLLSTIQDQTGLTPPAWMAQMPPTDQRKADSAHDIGPVVDKYKKVNGV